MLWPVLWPQADSVRPAIEPSREAEESKPPQAFHIPESPASLRTPPTDDAARNIWELRVAAYATAEQAAERLAGAPDALVLLGKLQLRCGSEQAAKTIWTSIVEQHPDFSEAYLDLGFLALNSADFATAQKRFEQALVHAPGTQEVFGPLADALLKQGKVSQAIGALDKALILNPADPGTWCKLGQAHYINQQWETAISSYQAALKVDPESAEALQGLLTTYRKQSDAEAAKDVAEQLARIEAQLMRVDANRDVVGRDLQVAQELLVFSTQKVATAYLSRNLVIQAQQALNSALLRIPASFELRGLSSRLYMQAQDFDNAIRTLQQLCEADANNPDNWLLLGETCIRCRRIDAAEAALQQAQNLAPERPDVYSLLAQTQMLGKRDPPGAVRSAQTLVKLSATAESHYILGTAYYHAGQIAKAEEELQIAIGMAPHNQEFRTALNNVRSE